jgi:hypothetical protein
MRRYVSSDRRCNIAYPLQFYLSVCDKSVTNNVEIPILSNTLNRFCASVRVLINVWASANKISGGDEYHHERLTQPKI